MGIFGKKWANIGRILVKKVLFMKIVNHQVVYSNCKVLKYSIQQEENSLLPTLTFNICNLMSYNLFVIAGNFPV